MGTTTIHGLRYPEAADPADVPTDMNELATDVDNALPPVSVNGRWLKGGSSGAMSWQPIAVGDLSFAGQPSGVATLDASGKVPAAQLPASSTIEAAYAQITSAVSVSVVAAASAVNVVSAGAVTFDGSVYVVEFYAPSVQTGATSGSQLVISLWLDGADIGRMAHIISPGALMAASVYARRRVQPAAGSHTYQAKAWSTVSAGNIQAGTGTTADSVSPAFIRISR